MLPRGRSPAVLHRDMLEGTPPAHRGETDALKSQDNPGRKADSDSGQRIQGRDGAHITPAPWLECKFRDSCRSSLKSESDRLRDRDRQEHTQKEGSGKGKRTGEKEFRPCPVWDSQEPQSRQTSTTRTGQPADLGSARHWLKS